MAADVGRSTEAENDSRDSLVKSRDLLLYARLPITPTLRAAKHIFRVAAIAKRRHWKEKFQNTPEFGVVDLSKENFAFI